MAINPSTFSEERFLTDVKHVCAILNTPYSEQATRKMIAIFRPSFERGCVLWRTTDQPTGPLNYRVYERKSIDLVAIARTAGLLPRDDALGDLVQAWVNEYISLAGAGPIHDDLCEDIQRVFPESGGIFAVTVDCADGRISRVAFYALRLGLEDLSGVNERILRFFAVCPSYDHEDMKALARSFGEGGNYTKAEHSHSGGAD
ncbi:aromatic prenyltransferase Orf2-domain-containing protein [Aspergillus aurantiobrunneus]